MHSVGCARVTLSTSTPAAQEDNTNSACNAHAGATTNTNRTLCALPARPSHANCTRNGQGTGVEGGSCAAAGRSGGGGGGNAALHRRARAPALSEEWAGTRHRAAEQLLAHREVGALPRRRRGRTVRECLCSGRGRGRRGGRGAPRSARPRARRGGWREAQGRRWRHRWRERWTN